MLKEIIFNKLKWFNVDDNAKKMTANGKNWIAMPSKIIVHKGAHMWGKPYNSDTMSCIAVKDFTINCQGIYHETSASTTYYVFDTPLNVSEIGTTANFIPGLVDVKDCTPIFDVGGGKAPL